MIEYVSGKFAEKTPTYVVVDVNGLGYLVMISLTTYGDLADESSGKLHTHYAVSVDVRSGESRHQIFGFSTLLERQLFRQLITVSGVSSGIAHMILSAFKPEEVQSIIVNGDDKSLTSVKGVGPKLAQKVISELREKLVKLDIAVDISEVTGNSLRQEALSALTALGFDRAKSVKVINQIIKNEAPETVEILIKKALKQL
ncbi:MAG: Holliday junction branch migration protein RuvA [Flavobacteriales bacterium]